MSWNLLQTNWPYKDEDVRQPRPTKERWFVDHAGVTTFEGTEEQCKIYRRQHGGIVRHYIGVSEEYLAAKRDETRYQWTGSGTKQTMTPDNSPGVIWMNGTCYRRRQKR